MSDECEGQNILKKIKIDFREKQKSKTEKFLKEADEFKKTTEYESLPLSDRDSFNQEIGKLKVLLEFLE